MGPLSRDHDVRMELGIAPSTLRALIADGARAGIAPPFAGAERLRRWRGGPELWLEWVSEVQAWRASRKETAASGCDGEPAQASPAVVSAPTGRPRAHPKPKSSARQISAETGLGRIREAMVEAVGKIPPVGRGSINLDERWRAAGVGE